VPALGVRLLSILIFSPLTRFSPTYRSDRPMTAISSAIFSR
jgi:hypothetical protein